jgi:hypothetical protein
MNEPDLSDHFDTPTLDERADEDTDGGGATANPPLARTSSEAASAGTNGGTSAALLNRDDIEHFRSRWNDIQVKFVDEPRSSVQQADALVSEAVDKITQIFGSERSTLESQWKQNNNVSTEDLRQALQHYRSFFNRLVG